MTLSHTMSFWFRLIKRIRCLTVQKSKKIEKFLGLVSDEQSNLLEKCNGDKTMKNGVNALENCFKNAPKIA